MVRRVHILYHVNIIILYTGNVRYVIIAFIVGIAHGDDIMRFTASGGLDGNVLTCCVVFNLPIRMLSGLTLSACRVATCTSAAATP